MSSNDAGPKDLLRRDIEDQKRIVARLRRQLATAEPRLSQSIRFFRSRFGEDPSTAETPALASSDQASARPLRNRITHADHSAVAITEANSVGVGLKVQEIRQMLVAAGLGREDYPTRETLISTLSRSPLFERAGPGLFRLLQPYRRDDLPESDRVAHGPRPPAGEVAPAESEASSQPQEDASGLAESKLAVLIEILRESGPLRFEVLYTRMQAKIPGLHWKSPSESIRGIAKRSKGVLVNAGKGKWKLRDA